jgi:fructosamine-3-kinase
MLRMLAGAGIRVPSVEGEHEGVLLIEHVPNDGIFSPSAWSDIGALVRALHERIGEEYGWPVDYRLGTVELDNRQTRDWPSFWSQRLVSTASVLDRPWRERVAVLAGRLPGLLPPQPTASLLHGDLWSGNILVSEGKLAALIDPACCYGDAEADLAMLTLFGEPPQEFWSSYGEPVAGWQQRRPVYQLFPALVHLRLFGPTTREWWIGCCRLSGARGRPGGSARSPCNGAIGIASRGAMSSTPNGNMPFNAINKDRHWHQSSFLKVANQLRNVRLLGDNMLAIQQDSYHPL